MRGTHKYMKNTTIRILFFIGGFSTVFILLGATATGLGAFLTSHQSTFEMVAGAILILFGLHLTGLVPIKFLYREARFGSKLKPQGPIGAYVLGTAFAFGWTPCVGPILAAIFMLAEKQETVWGGMGLLAIYSLGLGIPFFITGIMIVRAMKAFDAVKKHFRKIELVSGILVLMLGVLFLFQNTTLTIDNPYIGELSLTLSITELSNLFSASPDLSAGLEKDVVGIDLFSIVWSFLGGLLSFSSPCVLPLVPSYIAFIAGAESPEELAGVEKEEVEEDSEEA